MKYIGFSILLSFLFLNNLCFAQDLEDVKEDIEILLNEFGNFESQMFLGVTYEIKASFPPDNKLKITFIIREEGKIEYSFQEVRLKRLNPKYYINFTEDSYTDNMLVFMAEGEYVKYKDNPTKYRKALRIVMPKDKSKIEKLANLLKTLIRLSKK